VHEVLVEHERQVGEEEWLERVDRSLGLGRGRDLAVGRELGGHGRAAGVDVVLRVRLDGEHKGSSAFGVSGLGAGVRAQIMTNPGGPM
jgi:hypothetical protein